MLAGLEGHKCISNTCITLANGDKGDKEEIDEPDYDEDEDQLEEEQEEETAKVTVNQVF